MTTRILILVEKRDPALQRIFILRKAQQNLEGKNWQCQPGMSGRGLPKGQDNILHHVYGHLPNTRVPRTIFSDVWVTWRQNAKRQGTVNRKPHTTKVASLFERWSFGREGAGGGVESTLLPTYPPPPCRMLYSREAIYGYRGSESRRIFSFSST